jgi:hypothetical protein
MAENSIDIVFSAVDKSSGGVSSVLSNLTNLKNAAGTVMRAFDRAWDALDKLTKDYATWAGKSNDPKAVQEAEALRDSFERVNNAVQTIKFSLLEITAGPLANFLSMLEFSANGYIQTIELIKANSEIEAIAARMREEQGAGAGTAYGPGSQLGQGLKDEAAIMEAAKQEWVKQQEELAVAQAAAEEALPPAEIAKATTQGMDAIKDVAVALTPEAIANMHAFMDAVTSVDTGNLDQAYKEIKDLVGLNGQTITIYVDYVTAPGAPDEKEAGKGATSGGSGGNTYQFYGASTQDILAELRA